MNQITDMNAVKDVALSFLYLDIEEEKSIPLFVQHPIFQNRIMFVGDQRIDLLSDDADIVRDFYTEKIQAVSSLDTFFCIIRKPYYLAFLKYAKPFLSVSDFSHMLGEAWTLEEMPNDDVNVSVSQAVRWFRSADKKFLMNDSEYQAYQNLPDILTVYRGVTPGHNPDGLSWTSDIEKAQWFANRFGSGYLLKGTARKKDVLAYFGRRREEEVVISPKKLSNISRI